MSNAKVICCVCNDKVRRDELFDPTAAEVIEVILPATRKRKAQRVIYEDINHHGLWMPTNHNDLTSIIYPSLCPESSLEHYICKTCHFYKQPICNSCENNCLAKN